MKTIFKFGVPLLWAAVLLCQGEAPAGAGELDSKMERSAKGLAKEGANKGLAGAALAVFPFQTDEALAKKRVNFAVSELYVEQLHKTGGFKLIERLQLDAVLKEQKIGLSGAVDSETAARVGKVVGARLLLIGSVSRMGKSYQISARLIDSESAQIAASDIIEVPVAVFDEEAARYVTLVPEKEALGLYLAVRPGKLSENLRGPQTRLGATITPQKGDPWDVGAGLGVRYWLDPSWMADVAYFPTAYRMVGAVTASPQPWAPDISVSEVRLLLHRAWCPSEKWRILAGAGASIITLRNSWTEKTIVGGVQVGQAPGAQQLSTAAGILRLGGEWRPKKRIGLAVFADLNQGAKEYAHKAEFRTFTPGAIDNAVLAKYKLPAYTVEASLSVNF